MRRFWKASVALLALFACSDESSTSPSAPVALKPSGQASIPGVSFLPYGVPAPDPLPPNVIPEPYDPAKHGPPIPNSAPHLNLPEHERTFVASREPSPGLTLALGIPEGNTNKGLRWFSTTYPGIYAGHEIETGIRLPAHSQDQFVFAPTALPSGSACIEMATTHRRRTTETTTRHLAGWWNWCLSSGLKPTTPSVEEDMTTSWWQQWYTRRVIGGSPVFFIEIFKDTQQGYPCWNGLIFNYNKGYWESKFYSCYAPGKTQNNRNSSQGWTLWEGDMNEKPCPSLVGTGAHDILAVSPNLCCPAVNISQVAPALSTGEGICWGSFSTWTMDYIKGAAASAWRAKTPNP